MAPFDYNKTHHLIDFFVHYSKVPAPMCSMDESVLDSLPDEETTARIALRLDQTTWLVKLLNPHAEGFHYYITPTPEATSYTPPGHATHSFKTLDVS